MSNYIKRICPVCNTEYQADIRRLKHGRQTTCSRKCSYEYRSNKLQKKEVRHCDNCGADITRIPAYFKENNFCSTDCLFEYRSKNAKHPSPKQKKFCLVCGNIFKPKNKSGRIQSHCSRKCFEISHKQNMAGDSNPSYIDGRSYDTTYDAGADWKEIRMKVYKRDNYTCQKCGVKCVSKKRAMDDDTLTRRIIQCHHIKPYELSQDNSLSNLITLCIVCHRAVHTEMDKTNSVD